MTSPYDLHLVAIAAIAAIALIAATEVRPIASDLSGFGARKEDGSEKALVPLYSTPAIVPVLLAINPEGFAFSGFGAIAAIAFIFLLLGFFLTPKAAAEVVTTEAIALSIFQHMDAGVLLTGPRGEIRLSNPAACEMLGLTETDLLGQIAFDRLPMAIAEDGTLLTADANPVARAIATAQPVRDVVLGIRSQTEAQSEKRETLTPLLTSHFSLPPFPVKWLLVNANPQLDSEGCVAQVVCTCTDISDRFVSAQDLRQQVEEQLRTSEAEYRSLFENAVEGIFQIATDGHYIKVNPAFARLYGYEIIEDFLKAIAEEEYRFYVDSFRYLEFFRQLQERDIILNFESEFYRRDGRIIWISENVRSVRDADGKLLYYEGTAIDITERKRSQEVQEQLIASLHKSEERFQQLAGNGGAIYQCRLGVDGSLSFPFVSGGCRDLCELEPEEIIADANSLIDLIHPDDRATWEESLFVASATLQLWEWEWRLIATSGDIKWVKGLARPELLACGDILWDGLLIDITDSKLAEDALQKQEQKMVLHFQQTPLAVISWSLTFEVTEWNPAATRIFGYSKSEALGRHILELLVPESDRDRVKQVCTDLLNQKGGIRSTSENLTKEGKIIVCEWYNTPLVDATDRAIGFASLAEDITERKRAEEALKESEQRFRAIAEATPIPIIISRVSNQGILYANPALEKAIGVSEKELSERKILDFYYKEADRLKVVSALEKDGYARGLEICAKKIDGTPFWITLSLQPLSFNGEKAILFAFYDITDRKRVEEVLRSRSRLSTLAAEIGVALVQSSNLPEIFHRCTETMELCLDVAFAGIWRFNAGNNLLELQAFSGEQPATTEFQDRIPLGFSLIGYVAQNRQSYLTMEGGKMKEEGAIASSRDLDPQSSFLASYPLIVEDRLVGVMALMSRLPYTEADRSTLSWVASAIAVAIDRLLARQELLSRREALLFHLASQIRTSLEINTILETAVREIRSLLSIDRCLFIWYNPDSKNPELEVVTEAKDRDLKSAIGRYSAKVNFKAIQRLLTQSSIRVDDAQTIDDVVLKKFAFFVGCASILALPIQTRGGAIGIIGCGQHRGARSWNDSEVELLQAVTAQLAIAIDQAELYAQSLNAAAVARAKAEQLELALHELQQTQAQLIQTEKMSSLGQLVAGVAHEINNPVNFIYANLSYAENYTTDLIELVKIYQQEYPNNTSKIQDKIEAIDFEFLIEDLPKIMSSMQVGAERIRQIVLSLRNFSRLDEAEMKKVDLHEGIDNTLLILQNRLKPGGSHPGIEVIKEYGQLPHVECYAGQLNQVFMNIISNAIDALETQGKLGQITIRTELVGDRSILPSSLPMTPAVAIRISDNGPGMKEAVKDRIFDPFFTTKPVGKGTGLGLSVAYQIVVSKHKGMLKCYSETGQGTELWIEIPILQGNG